MTNKETILKNLERQKIVQGVTDDILILEKFLNVIKSSSQWQAFVNPYDGERYGKLSFQVHRFYRPTNELRALLTKD